MQHSRRRESAVRSASRARAPLAAIAIAALFASSACHKKVKPHVAIAPHAGATEVGDASWYGYPYHGRRAANGEIYDMEKLTAAHRTLPFETWVEVRNLSNEKKVTVRITDRGPFVDGRIIDLSNAQVARWKPTRGKPAGAQAQEHSPILLRPSPMDGE